MDSSHFHGVTDRIKTWCHKEKQWRGEFSMTKDAEYRDDGDLWAGRLRGKAWGKAAGVAEMVGDEGVRSEPMQCTACWVRRRTDWTLGRILILNLSQRLFFLVFGFWFFFFYISALDLKPICFSSQCAMCTMWLDLCVCHHLRSSTKQRHFHLMQQKASICLLFFSKYYVYFKYKSCLWAKQVVHKGDKYNAWERKKKSKWRGETK